MLPPKVNSFHNHIFTRIFRFIGGLCLILVLSHKYLVLPGFLHWPIIILGFLQSIQMIIFYVIRAIYALYILIYRRDLFEVRNSP